MGNRNERNDTRKAQSDPSRRAEMLETDELVLPVIQEELQVGKRQVESGGVRVTTDVKSTPVEEQVTLREEKIDIERRPVNRAVTDADMTAFKNGVIEVTTTGEEAMISKQARVVEEVRVGKHATQHTETVRDSVRRTDVQIEQLAAPAMNSRADMSRYHTYDNDYQRHFQSKNANSGYTYEQYAPIYEYGYSLGTDKHYGQSDWKSVEKDARQGWEETNPGTWDEFKDSVHYAWDKARGQR